MFDFSYVLILKYALSYTLCNLIPPTTLWDKDYPPFTNEKTKAQWFA